MLQPVHWWMNNHIKDGKKGFNLDEYASRSLRYQYNKMKDVVEQDKGWRNASQFLYLDSQKCKTYYRGKSQNNRMGRVCNGYSGSKIPHR